MINKKLHFCTYNYSFLQTKPSAYQTIEETISFLKNSCNLKKMIQFGNVDNKKNEGNSDKRFSSRIIYCY